MGVNYARLFVNTRTDLRPALGATFGERGIPEHAIARLHEICDNRLEFDDLWDRAEFDDL